MPHLRRARVMVLYTVLEKEKHFVVSKEHDWGPLPCKSSILNEDLFKAEFLVLYYHEGLFSIKEKSSFGEKIIS